MRIKHLILLTGLALLALSCDNKEKPDDGSSSGSKPAAPTGLKVHSHSENSLTFMWDPMENATGYYYELTQGGKQVLTGGTQGRLSRSCSLTDLSKGTTYTFTVYSVADSYKSAGTSVNATTDGEADPETPTPSYADFKIPSSEEADGKARAFPGAEGGGMYTTGGRGGKVYHVTNLNDSGSGSLRYGIEKGERPLTIVFDVAGIIALQSDLKIEKGDLTIAGQTAPGDGICLKNYTTYVGADNVIIRFLRFRLGDEANWSASDISAGKADGEDAIWGRYQKNIILDHCSMSWSIDETASFYANANFTMQWCIIAESMKSCRLHSKGDHGYGGIWGGKDASFHHNLLAHHSNRTPRFDHQYLYDGNGVSTSTYRGYVDFRNCVIYNWGNGNGCYGGEGGHYNLVNNYYKKGSDSNDKKYFIEADGGYSTKVKENGVEVTKYFDYDWAQLYLSGNYNNEYPDGHSSYPDGVYWKIAYSDYNKSYDGHISANAFSIKGKDGVDAYTTTHSAQKAMEQVCSYAGASLKRDAVDSRIAKDVGAKTGRIIKDIQDVKDTYGSAWPAYSGETRSSFPSWVGDPNAYTLDSKRRYTNLEMYLHYLVKDVVSGGNEGGTYTKL